MFFRTHKSMTTHSNAPRSKAQRLFMALDFAEAHPLARWQSSCQEHPREAVRPRTSDQEPRPATAAARQLCGRAFSCVGSTPAGASRALASAGECVIVARVAPFSCAIPSRTPSVNPNGSASPDVSVVPIAPFLAPPLCAPAAFCVCEGVGLRTDPS